MKNIPIPKKMRALGRDSRGYPIPFIVLRDTDGCPHFAANNTMVVLRAFLEDRCAICGTSLKGGLKWLVGGPLSAFHPQGAFADTALHYECMAYALQVCPYLSSPRYLRDVGTPRLKPEKMPDGLTVMIDWTMLPDRPPLFVAVATKRQLISTAEKLSVKPERPLQGIEFWRHGARLPDQEGALIAREALQSFVKTGVGVTDGDDSGAGGTGKVIGTI